MKTSKLEPGERCQWIECRYLKESKSTILTGRVILFLGYDNDPAKGGKGNSYLVLADEELTAREIDEWQENYILSDISMRDDIMGAVLAHQNDWVVQYDRRDQGKNDPEYIPMNSISFSRKDKRLWKVGRWICADIVGVKKGYSRFENHRLYNSLIDAMDKES